MPMRGFIEFVEPREIRGWAYDSDRPDYPVKVVVTVDDEELGTTVADISRADLGAANVGDGRHGFALVLQPPLLIDQLGKVEVAAISAEGVPAILQRTRFASDVMKSTGPLPWPSDPSQHPVFILGTTRSGTSAVSLALLKSGAYGGAGEGHVLELLGDLLDTIENYYRKWPAAASPQSGSALKRIPSHQFAEKIAHIFLELVKDLYPSSRWVDKTPSFGMVRLSPLFLTLWPNAKFIFMKRRGIENVESKRRKFRQSVASACREWAGVMNGWLRVRTQLGGKDVAIELDQIDLAINPTGMARVIADHVALPDERFAAFATALCDDRPELTSEKFASVVELSEIAWSEQEKRIFRDICGSVMDAYGYTYDRTYRTSDPLPL